jgi:hypothetical protein
MFGILPGLGKIRVRILQHRILIAMPKLFLQSDIPRRFVVLSFGGALRSVLIDFMCHDETSRNNFQPAQFSARTCKIEER